MNNYSIKRISALKKTLYLLVLISGVAWLPVKAQDHVLKLSNNGYNGFSSIYPASSYISCSSLSVGQTGISKERYFECSTPGLLSGRSFIPRFAGTFTVVVKERDVRTSKTFVFGQGEKCTNTPTNIIRTIASFTVKVEEFRFPFASIEHCKTAGNLNLSALLSTAGDFSGTGVFSSDGTWYLDPTTITTDQTANIQTTKIYPNGAANALLSVIVRDKESISFQNLPIKIWQKNAVTLDLSKHVNIQGGEYYIDNKKLSGSIYTFENLADAGDHTIKYIHTNSFGCIAEISAEVKIVRNFTAVGNNGQVKTWCANGPVLTLHGNQPDYGDEFAGAWTLGGETFHNTNTLGMTPSLHLNVGTNNLSFSLTHEGFTDVANVLVIVIAPTSFDITNAININKVRQNDAPFNLLVSSVGGGSVSWQGSVAGVISNEGTFNPAAVDVSAGPVDIICTATVTNSADCHSSKNITVTVVPSYVLSIKEKEGQTLQDAYCKEENQFELSLSHVPSAGQIDKKNVFGAGIIKDGEKYYFDPDKANIGLNTITYSIEAYGFTYSKSINVTINQATPIQAGLDQKLCIGANPIDLELVSVPSTSGTLTWSGKGVAGNQFSPVIAGIGIHEVIATFSNPQGCTSRDTVVFTVENNAQANVKFSPPEDVLVNTTTNLRKYVSLDDLPLEGGSFTGNGVSGDNFVATDATGSFEVTFISPNNALGCKLAEDITFTMHVRADFQVSVEANKSLCLNASEKNLQGTPAGGIWSGNGIIDGKFNAAKAGPGLHSITYAYSLFGITKTAALQITVLELPQANAGQDVSVCKETIRMPLLGAPANGFWEGEGVRDGVFYPREVGEGTYKITYKTINESGCSQTDTVIYKVVEDLNLPAPQVDGIKSACAGTSTTLVASNPKVAGAGLSFEWYKSGSDTPFHTGSSLDYTITKSETLILKQISASCSSNSVSQVNLVNLGQNYALHKITATGAENKKSQTSEVIKFEVKNDKGERLNDMGGLEFIFDFGDGTITDRRSSPEASHVYYKKGSYQVKAKVISSESGCENEAKMTDSLLVEKKRVEVVTGLSDNQPLYENKQDQRVYPNPFVKGKTLKIILSERNAKIIQGKKINVLLSSPQTVIFLDIVTPQGRKIKIKDQKFKGLSAGLYFLRVFDASGVYFDKKFIIR